MVTMGPKISGCNREVAALKRCTIYGVCHLELELSGCNKEVAALHSDHYTQVRLYNNLVGMDVMYDRMHHDQCPVTINFIKVLLITPFCPMVTHIHPVAGNLPMKTVVAR